MQFHPYFAIRKSAVLLSVLTVVFRADGTVEATFHIFKKETYPYYKLQNEQIKGGDQ
jgi:hypothetical protein